MKPGTIFEHKYWSDIKRMPQLCVVTAMRNQHIYFKALDSGKPIGSLHDFHIGYQNRNVGQILEEPK
jgi:hypothetical protein